PVSCGRIPNCTTAPLTLAFLPSEGGEARAFRYHQLLSRLASIAHEKQSPCRRGFRKQAQPFGLLARRGLDLTDHRELALRRLLAGHAVFAAPMVELIGGVAIADRAGQDEQPRLGG